MKQMSSKLIYLLWLSYSLGAFAQGLPSGGTLQAPSRAVTTTPAALDSQREKHALHMLLAVVQKNVASAAEAMPADKYNFTPSDGEFKGVRTFGQMIKHVSATNHILAAAALGENPPADAGDETGPEAVRTKAELAEYLSGSFARLSKAIDAIGEKNIPINVSPISPFKPADVTRSGLVTEALIHAYDHYGQMVEYLRMNGVVPPASRP